MSDLKATLNDKVIGRLPPADKGQYIVRDTELSGFFIVVGARRKTFTVQGEFWKDDKRQSKKVALGSTEDINTRDARVLAKEAQVGRLEGANGGQTVVGGRFARRFDGQDLADADDGLIFRDLMETAMCRPLMHAARGR
jgi:hypothetical protein